MRGRRTQKKKDKRKKERKEMRKKGKWFLQYEKQILEKRYANTFQGMMRRKRDRETEI